MIIRYRGWACVARCDLIRSYHGTTIAPMEVTQMAKKIASHVTDKGTQKYQCNGPSEWAPFFAEIAERIAGKGAPAGVGIRAVLAAAFAEHTAAKIASVATAAGVSKSALVIKPRVVKGADVKAAAKAAKAAKDGDK